MAAGDLTVTLVGTSFSTIELAVARMDTENLPAATDRLELLIEPGIGPNRYKILKTVRATS